MPTPEAKPTTATCTCDPRHIELGATDPWCEAHGENS